MQCKLQEITFVLLPLVLVFHGSLASDKAEEQVGFNGKYNIICIHAKQILQCNVHSYDHSSPAALLAAVYQWLIQNLGMGVTE